MFSNRYNKNVYFLREETQNDDRGKKWDERFFLDKIPPYDAYKDVNYLSLGLIKSKIKYEKLLEKQKLNKYRLRNPIYSEHYLLDSQPKKTTSNKKLIFSINLNREKNKNDDSKKSHSLTYSHRLERKKSSLLKSNNKICLNNNNYKYKNNYEINNTLNENIKNNLTVEENDLLEEFEIIKVMWNRFGVTKKYQDNFVNFLNSIEKKESIKQFLILEKKQMQKFKYDFTQLLKKIIHRNDEISNLKKLIILYINILNDKKFYHIKNNENEENLSIKNEKKIISDIHESLLSVRINTINVINQIKGFFLAYSYYFHMNKIDLNLIKNDYYFNDEYLISIKNDLDFVQNPAMQNLYDFKYLTGNDPFFLSFTKFPEKIGTIEKDDNNENNKKAKLPINEKMLTEIQNCLFFLNQAEILGKTKHSPRNKNKIINFIKSRKDINYNGTNNNEKGYGIGSVFKGNLERNIVKLKMQKGYNKLFTFVSKSYSTPKNDIYNNLKKKTRTLPLMTSHELKEKFNEYELINSLLYENNNDYKDEKEKDNIDIINEEYYKTKDKEIMYQKIKDLEKGKEKKELKKIKKEENKDKLNQLTKEKKEEDEYEDKLNQLAGERNEENYKKEKNKKLEKDKKKKEKNTKLEEEHSKFEEEKEKEKELIMLEDQIKESKEEIEIKKENNKSKSIEEKIEEEEKKEYIINYFTGTLEELNILYEDYLSRIQDNIKKEIYFPEQTKDFICNLYPKIIIAKEKKENIDKINGICGINNYIDNNNELILKINHISSIETNKEIIDKFIDLIESTLEYKIIEIELNNSEQTDNKNDLYNIIIKKYFKEYNKSQEKIILRKNNTNNINIDNELETQIKYDSLSVLSLVNKNEFLDRNKKQSFKGFNNVINEINLILLINNLKNNDKYKVEILNSSFYGIFLEKLSNLDNQYFDFIKLKNNNCLNIEEITNNEIIAEREYNYSIINNNINIRICTFMTLNIDNYLYNGVEINIKNNLIQDTKYMNNLFCIPALNKNINIIIYQYNDIFEKDFFNKKNNIYIQFISLFKDYIKNMKINENEDNNNENKKFLWIPAFNINTNLFSSKLNISNDINIKNEESNDMNILEFNDILKLNYLPEKNQDKNIKLNINNNENLIIKEKFIMGIYHKELMEKLDIPVISLVNITSDNFIKA